MDVYLVQKYTEDSRRNSWRSLCATADFQNRQQYEIKCAVLFVMQQITEWDA